MNYKSYLKLVAKREADVRVEIIGIERAARVFKYPILPFGWCPEKQIYFRKEVLKWGQARFRLNRIYIPPSIGNEELAYYFKKLRQHAFVYKGKIERFYDIPEFYIILMYECGVFKCPGENVKELIFNGFYEYNVPKIENRKELISRIGLGLLRIYEDGLSK